MAHKPSRELPQTQEERRLYLIRHFMAENNQFSGDDDRIPADEAGQRRVLRGFMNVRPPRPASADVLAVQDAYLQELQYERGVTAIEALLPVRDGMYVWMGDPTTLAVDALVNAADPTLLGCFTPLHDCVDNLVHTYAGIQLRLECASIVNRQGHQEPVGHAQVTAGYNLPAKHVIHTVGPVLRGESPTPLETADLTSCYRACMDAATELGLRSIAFPPIARGMGGFPAEVAARVAVGTVRRYRAEHEGAPEALFVVFSEADHALFRDLIANRREQQPEAAPAGR